VTDGPSLPLVGREDVLEHAATLILEAWKSFDRARPNQPPPAAHHLEMLNTPLPAEGCEPVVALDAAADVLDVSLAQSRPRFFAYIGSSGLEIGVLGDALMASHDVNVATSAGAADMLEAQTIRWVGAFTGFDPEAQGLTAAGGTVSNLTALTAARERALPGTRRTGVGGRRMALYCSAEAHYSVRRAAEVLGVGADNVRAIPIDEQRRIRVDECARAIAADRRAGVVPVAVVATSGTTLTGAVDDIDGLADVCAEHEVWLHVDGAYGLPAAATERAGKLFEGLDRADSATVDAHKWLYVPKSCSVLLVHDAAALERAFSHREGYMLHGDEQLNPVDRTLEYSRPLSALKLWLAFRVHGARAIRAAIERNLEQAALLASLLRDDERFELLGEPQLSVVCFRRRHGGDIDAHHAALASALAADGRIAIAPAEVDSGTWLRACFVNHRTTEEDVRAVPDVVGEISDALLSATA